MSGVPGKPDAAQLIATVEAYFARVDSGDVEGTLELMTPDCYLEVTTAGVHHEGRETGVRGVFERRLEDVAEAWHGDFTHVADGGTGRVASRFAVRRLAKDGTRLQMDNINMFLFEGPLIKAISVWMSDENTLV